MVADLVNSDLGIWDQGLIRRHFDEFSAQLIFLQPAPCPDGIDKFIWTLNLLEDSL